MAAAFKLRSPSIRHRGHAYLLSEEAHLIPPAVPRPLGPLAKEHPDALG
jgi:hypothetical protein